MKQKIVFFSRCELTYLYGSLHKYLSDTYEVLHVAYDDEEEKILKEQFGITTTYHLKKMMRAVNQEELSKVCLEEIDMFLQETTLGKFNINASLQANRTSRYLTYEQNIVLLKTYYIVWGKFFKEHKIDLFIHEPVSLLMNQIAASFCKKNKAVYSTHILSESKDDSQYYYMMVDDYNGIPTTLEKKYNAITPEQINENKQQIQDFLGKFRKELQVFFAQLGTGTISQKDFLKLRLRSFLSSAKRKVFQPNYDLVVDNIELFIYKNNLSAKRAKNLKEYKNISFQDLDITKKYYFYPMHLEPEAVVLYWADDRYTHQIKLIENIASQLPPDTFLYVKDHPHSFGYRGVEDYKRLIAIPNIRLLKTSIPGRQVISHSQGVFTITGTGGFEALMMNKHVITFAKTFYSISERVHYLDNVFKVKELIYRLKDEKYQDDENLYRFTLAYLQNLNKGFTNFYNNMHNKIHFDFEKDAKIVAESFHQWFNYLKNE